MLTNEQVIAAQKAQLEAFHELTTHYVSSVEKLTELNLRLAKDCLQDSATNASKMLDSMGGQDQQASSLNIPAPDSLLPRLTDYCKHLFELATSIGHEFNEKLSSNAEKAHKQLIENTDEAIKNTSPGSEPVVKAVRNALENTKITQNVVRDVLQKSGKSDK